MTETSIIKSLKLDPLLLKAGDVAYHYETAGDCTATVLGPNFNYVQDSKKSKAMRFCTICKHYNKNACQTLNGLDCPCAEMHLDAVKTAQNRGGSYIYMCKLGLLFWTSPFFSGEHFAGALIASGFIGVERKQALESVYEISGGEIPRSEINRYLDEFPEKTYEDVKALAHTMLVCAEQLSISREKNEPLFAAQHTLPSCKNNAEKERAFIASLRRGDTDEARKTLGEMLEKLHSGNNIETLKLQATELAVLVSRAAVSADNEDTANIMELNNRYLKKIEESQNAEEIFEILNLVIDRMSAKIFSFRGIRHCSALRKAERFIWENYTRKISLEEIAGAAGLSAPYFSTIFKEEMGENLSVYLNRLRVKKAASMLTETNLSISEIATACGFEDQSWFSKIFKSFTGLTPGKYHDKGASYSISEWAKGGKV
jgi:AraC-like DNA-binding protein/ligand-binding sensor protein